jgi:hypothetical protein
MLPQQQVQLWVKTWTATWLATRRNGRPSVPVGRKKDRKHCVDMKKRWQRRQKKEPHVEL